ncbi:alanine--tRNA ligase [Patescibacteria group bacterium]|nr:alanine--tRNA ligase [Patescibacteria group bacterium]
MQANQLRAEFISFFTTGSKDHKKIPSASLLPENDPTTLFISSGMQPLVPYLLGEKHPLGSRLVNSQLCFRAEDIAEVGDNRHTTFFEMLGNWSLGDYFKQDQLTWFFEFLTQVIGLDPHRLYVSVFEGNEAVSQDKESIELWQKLFSSQQSAQSGKAGFDPKIKIYTYGADKNWWSRSGTPDKMPAGEIGGPDSEVFYDFGQELGLHEKSAFKNKPCHLNCDCGRFLEIGNSVFMEYKKTTAGNLEKLPKKNVDFGGGLERILAAKANQPDIFKTDIFWPLIKVIEKTTDRKYSGNETVMRIIADHLKAATFMMAEGLEPSNKQAGYVLRRLLRRAAVKMRQLNTDCAPTFDPIALKVVELYPEYLKPTVDLKEKLKRVIGQEIERFAASLDRGLKEFAKADDGQLDTLLAFNLFQTYGFPFEVTEELFKRRGKSLDKKAFDVIYKEHQQLSRTASQGMFKGGLADQSETVTKLHTATHLLHAALRKILGEHVQQVGSNITAERLRFDFVHSEKLTAEQLKQIEELINQQINNDFPVKMMTMSLSEAKAQGALACFGQKYPAQVKVYTVSNFSKELCGGPHVSSTKELGEVKIVKQESCGAGRRRIYARLVN